MNPVTIVLGPPGTGKSTLLGSAISLGKSLLLATKPREANSWLYAKAIKEGKLDHLIFHDSGFVPELGKFGAKAYLQLLKAINDLYSDDMYDVVLLDPFTDVGVLASNQLLAAAQVGTPKELPDTIGYYGALYHLQKRVISQLAGLASDAAKRPKHILIACHTQPTTEEDIKKMPTRERKAKGVEYEGDVLPAVDGKYRRIMAGDADLVLFTQIKRAPPKPGKKTGGIEYVVDVRPNNKRHAKIAVAPLVEVADMPNDYPAILKALRGTK